MTKIALNLMPEAVPYDLLHLKSKPVAIDPLAASRKKAAISPHRFRKVALVAARPALLLAALLSNSIPAIGQLPASSGTQEIRSPLAEVTKHAQISVRLAPAQRQAFAPPLWPAGTLLSLRYRPASAQTAAAPTTLGQAIAPRAAIASKAAPPLTISVSASGRVLPVAADSDRVKLWRFSIPANATSVVVTVQNVASTTVQGTIEVESHDSPALAALRSASLRNQLITRARTAPKPDALYAIAHMLDRHFLRYPGGMSSVEQRIQRAVASGNLSESVLRRLQQRFAVMKPELTNRVVNRSMTTVPVHSPLPETTVKAALFVPGKVYPATPYRYSIRLLGVKSWRCADDVGAEYGCDREEPFVSWVAQGADYARVGRTEAAADIVRYSEAFYNQSVNVLSAGADNSTATTVSFPFAFFFQVVEDDPGGPSREEVLTALTGGVDFVKALYGEGLPDVLSAAPAAIISIYSAVLAELGGGDDYYQMLVSLFSASSIKSLTSGTAALPVDKPLFSSAGDYAGFSIRIVDVYHNGVKQWSLAYMITRQ